MSQLSTNDRTNDEQEQQQRYEDDESLLNRNKRSFRNISMTPEMVFKKMRRSTNDNENEEQEDGHQLSKYFEKLNVLFDKMMMNYTTTIISIDDLRSLAILKHKIAIIKLDRKLWTFYLKLGKGQCETSESNKTNVDRCMWPMAIKKLCSSTMDIIDVSEKDDEHQSCEMIVDQHLEELNEREELYFMEYYEKKVDFIGLTNEMEQTMDTFVQQYSIVPYEMKWNHKIALLQYNYDEKLLELEYLRYKPTDNQVKSII